MTVQDIVLLFRTCDHAYAKSHYRSSLSERAVLKYCPTCGALGDRFDKWYIPELVDRLIAHSKSTIE